MRRSSHAPMWFWGPWRSCSGMSSILTAIGRPVMYVLLAVQPLLFAVALSPSTSLSISARSTPGYAMHLARIPGAPRGVGPGCCLRTHLQLLHYQYLAQPQHPVPIPGAPRGGGPGCLRRLPPPVGIQLLVRILCYFSNSAQAVWGQHQNGRHTSYRLAALCLPVGLLRLLPV